MDKFVANCKTVCSFLFGRGVVSQYGKVYFDSPEVAKVLVTPDYETVLKANEEYTSMVKILERLDCYEPVTLKFPRTNIWGETVTDTWHFEPIAGGFRWKDSVGDVHMDGYPAIVSMLFAKYCKVL